jgi:hypothetical protein
MTIDPERLREPTAELGFMLPPQRPDIDRHQLIQERGLLAGP